MTGIRPLTRLLALSLICAGMLLAAPAGASASACGAGQTVRPSKTLASALAHPAICVKAGSSRHGDPGPRPRPASKAAISSSCGPVAAVMPSKASKTALARTTVCLLNLERRKRGLRSLRINSKLSSAARAHSRDMVRRHYFDHVSRSGGNVVTRLRRTGYLSHALSWFVGENLAWGSGSRGTPSEIVKAWMHSPGHRRNILTGRFREIGIGIVSATPTGNFSDGGTYTTTFGTRR